MVNISGKHKKIGLSLLVGLLGGVMGFLEGEAAKWEGIDNGRSEYYGHFSVPAGVISGFLVCFLLYLLYLKFVKHRRVRLGWGALFGLSSGGLCGLTVGYALKYASLRDPLQAGNTTLDPFWIIPGAFFGMLIGFILASLFERRDSEP